jgi:hypothetical protein
MDLRARLADAEAQIESLQNRWAARPLSHADGEVLARENDELRAELATIKADHADCEEFARRLMDERDAALARLAEAELIAASWKREAEINEQIATEAERDAARYRWLRKAREHWDVLHREDEDAYWQDLAGNELDAAIDAAATDRETGRERIGGFRRVSNCR